MEAEVASIKDFEGRAIGPYALHSQTESRVLIRTELVIGQARDEAKLLQFYVRQSPARPDL